MTLKRKPIILDDTALKKAMDRSVNILEETARLADDDRSKALRSALFIAAAIGELVPLDDPKRIAKIVGEIAARMGQLMYDAGVHDGVFDDEGPGHAC